MEIDHEDARTWALRKIARGQPGPRTINLARAYLDLAPGPDADLIDEDPLPDDYDVDEVPGKPGRYYVSELVWQQGEHQFIGRKDAVREAWRRHHDDGDAD